MGRSFELSFMSNTNLDRGRIADMKNLGPESAERIVAVGIADADGLRAVGAAAAYRRVKSRFPDDTSLNLLWAMQGALMEIHWHEVPIEIKRQLLAELENL